MKKSLFSTVILFFVIVSLNAQSNTQTNDIILKVTGEEMVGHVTGINEFDISFIYKNENIPYQVKKTEIYKITFGSGRVEFFNKKLANKSSTLEEHHNKVAILPFAYIKDQNEGSDAMSGKIQHEMYSFLNKHKKELQFQDPTTTNNLLAKAGIVNNNLQGYTMGEICNILNVEYVLQGTVSVERGNQSNVNTYYNANKSSGNNDAYVDRHGHLVGNVNSSNKQSSYGTDISSNIQNYSTSMFLNIYNDKGDSIFSQDHTAFWNTKDAYKITITYLGKRSPLYKK